MTDREFISELMVLAVTYWYAALLMGVITNGAPAYVWGLVGFVGVVLAIAWIEAWFLILDVLQRE